MIKIKNWIKVIVFIGIAVLITYLVFQTEWFQMMKSGDLDTIIDKNVWFILTITLLMMIIQNTFTVIPLILVITVNYVLFGFMKGFLWSWLTSIIGSAIIFFGTRYLFQGWVKRKMDLSLRSKIEKNGFNFVFQARIIPFIPTSFINILSGVSSIKFSSFIIATGVGNFLYFFFMILIPAGLINVQINDYVLEASILLIFLLIFFFILKGRRKKRQKNSRYDGEN
ncbi:MAG: VTT domain-containing protein [Bacillus sp. (in: firmicutes)]